MRRKVLQDIANTLCQMMVGWRMGDDAQRMARLPDRTLVALGCATTAPRANRIDKLRLLVLAHQLAMPGHST